MINETMVFTTYNDFFKRRYIIKREFNKLNDEHKQVYKWYLYANRMLSTQKVNIMWEFLSEPENSIFRPTDELMKKYCTTEYTPENTESNNIEY